MSIKINNVTKSYGQNETYTIVLKGITTTIQQGSIVVIVGSSGSGKSTLLNCIGALEEIDSGSIVVDDVDLNNCSKDDLSVYRREKLGFIFQFYNLISNLTCKENIEVCRYLTKNPLDLHELLSLLQLSEHQHKYPSQLSGGQQQRCSIARALIKNPSILLCDEPTGALDSTTAKNLLLLLEKINETYKTTIVIVTHNDVIKQMAHQVIVMKDGQIESDSYNEHRLKAMELTGL